MILISLVLLKCYSLPFGKFEQFLSPYDIYWPESWQPNVVELTSNHASDTVNLTLNCHIYQSVPKGAYIQISIEGFPNKTYSAISEVDQPKEGDNQIVFYNVKLPDQAGAYGPISVVVRYEGNDSMLLAQSSSLTSIAILSPAPEPLPNLTVTYANGASRTISETTTLAFSFIITEPLYYNDYFVLDTDPDFNFEFINEGPIWDSANEDSKYFKNVRVKFDSNLGQLIFFGLDQEINSAAFFDVSIANIINPPSVTSQSIPKKWKMTIYRFGTPTIKQQVYEPGELQFPLPGKFKSPTWDFAYKTLDLNPLFKGFNTYMVLNFTLSHSIPENGEITITFTDSINIKKYNNQTLDYQKLNDESDSGYLHYLPNDQMNCYISTTVKVICEITRYLSKSDLITIYNMVYFGDSSPGIKSIISKDDKGQVIDEVYDSNSLKYNENSVYFKIEEEDSLFYIVNTEGVRVLGC